MPPDEDTTTSPLTQQTAATARNPSRSRASTSESSCRSLMISTGVDELDTFWAASSPEAMQLPSSPGQKGSIQRNASPRQNRAAAGAGSTLRRQGSPQTRHLPTTLPSPGRHQQHKSSPIPLGERSRSSRTSQELGGSSSSRRKSPNQMAKSVSHAQLHRSADNPVVFPTSGPSKPRQRSGSGTPSTGLSLGLPKSVLEKFVVVPGPPPGRTVPQELGAFFVDPNKQAENEAGDGSTESSDMISEGEDSPSPPQQRRMVVPTADNVVPHPDDSSGKRPPAVVCPKLATLEEYISQEGYPTAS